MGRFTTKKIKAAAAAQAREGRSKKRAMAVPASSEIEGNPDECTTWDGTVNYCPSDSECDIFSDWEGDSVYDDEDPDLIEVVVGEVDEDLDGDTILEALKAVLDDENEPVCAEDPPAAPSKPSAFDKLMQEREKINWSDVNSNRSLGYTGLAAKTKQNKESLARKQAEKESIMRKGASASAFRSFFQQKETSSAKGSGSNLDTATSIDSPSPPHSPSHDKRPVSIKIVPAFTGYLSDEPNDSSDDDDSPESISSQINTPHELPSVSDTFGVRAPPPRKRQRLDIPARVQRQQKQANRNESRNRALTDMERLIRSKRDVFDCGRDGLQAKRARAIQTCLHLVVRSHRTLIDASKQAAEATGFSEGWGGRQVRQWVATWIETRTLPKSERGAHKKVYSLLDDPEICTELRAYLRSNKWSMNPQKLSDLTKNKLLPQEAAKYAHHVVRKEMPNGLKQYLELELFPRIQMRVTKGIALRTAQLWLHKEGFQYTAHKKALFYDGHERPDVVHNRQEEFLPTMASLSHRLVSFSPHDPTVELPLKLNPGERKLVVVAHDEMTAQANDGQRMSWVWKGEQPLKKKGQGRGLHQSDVICSTKGWLSEASQTLEYGKNYNGYWTGALFAKQLKEKIIPAFERAHGPEYQALIMVDNSQGHSCYAEDALLTSRMNMRPGGKQAKMRNGWFMRDGVRVEQEMSFPADHPTYSNEAKGMKQVLSERGLWQDKLAMCCKKKISKGKEAQPGSSADADIESDTGRCKFDATSCCAKRILDLQPDFKAQKSLIQETVEASGHLCIFLPKFHCELNFIEYFWGAVKRYLRANCDYTFTGLQRNMPEALASVPVELIRRWENRTKRWMDAYRRGLNARDAQEEVVKFSSRKYASHRRVFESQQPPPMGA